MTAVTYVMSVPLVPADAIAALKLREGIDAMCARDDTLAVVLGPVNEIVLKGTSEGQLERAVDYLRRGTDAPFDIRNGPQVLYRESITRTIEWNYTHKKQTRGTGEYARVKIRFEPGAPGSGIQFSNKAGSNVPAAFVPAIEKGLATERENGPIAGLPVVDLACALVDGDYHDVDSSARTFEIAARACLREALPKAGPRVLEPLMLVVALTPEDYMGDVIGDLNGRRGEVRGFESHRAVCAITAIVPLANLFGYDNALRAMTRGRASWTIAFDRYEPIPPYPPGGDDDFPNAAALRW